MFYISSPLSLSSHLNKFIPPCGGNNFYCRLCIFFVFYIHITFFLIYSSRYKCWQGGESIIKELPLPGTTMKRFSSRCFIVLVLVHGTTCSITPNKFLQSHAKLQEIAANSPTNAALPFKENKVLDFLKNFKN